jgi:nitronate monooxygenase
MTRVFDIALEYPWPIKYPERILRNEFWERWQGQEEQLSADPEALSEFKASRARGNPGTTHVDAGQGVGRITQVRTASDVVSRLCAGAVELLGSWASNANWAKRS